MSELKQEIKDVVDITRAEASFKFELANVNEFFEIDGNERYSDRFWCRGMQWSINVEVGSESSHDKCLSFYLNCHNDDQVEWSCKANYKLILFNNLPGEQNYIGKATTTFHKEGDHGFYDYISYRELIDQKNGHVKNDKILLGVELKTEPVIRGN